MGNPTWRDTGDGFEFELTDAAGRPVAEVAFEESRGQRWSWYVTLPPDWQDGNGSPCGLARSAAAAKAICEAIVQATTAAA